VRVQPVAIDYGAAGPEIAWVGKEPGGANVRRVLSRPGTTAVTLTFLPPLDAAAFEDRKDLANEVRERIVAVLHPSARGADRL
jgi:1-acyl-sn-glycerol-3-phosphate acyltransferase